MILLPLIPNWSSPVKETRAFLTEVIESRDGTEQRRAIRTTPRRQIDFSALINGSQFNSLERLLDARRGQTFAIGEVVRGVRSTSAMPAGATTISLPSIPTWLVAGAYVTLSARRTVRLFEVDSVDGLAVTFTEPTDISWPSRSRLSPVVEGHISTSFSTSRETDNVARIEVRFEVLPAIEVPDEGTPSALQLDGIEVLTIRPNWAQSPEVTYVYDRETVDYDSGRIATIAPKLVGGRLSQATYLERSNAEVREAQQFFSRMKGQRGEFYASTWSRDMIVAEDIVEGAVTVAVTGTEVYDTYGDNPVFRGIAIRQFDGTLLLNRIEDMAIVGDDTVLTVANPWPDDVAAASVKSTSWLLLSRFATDTLTVEWITDELGQMVMTTQTLNTDAVFLDPLVQYMLSLYGEAFTVNVLCNPIYEAVNVTLPGIFAP